MESGFECASCLLPAARLRDDDCQTFFVSETFNLCFTSPSLLSFQPTQTSNNAAIVAIYIIHSGVKYLAPQWGICIIFSPLKQTRMSDEVDSMSWAQKPVYYPFSYTVKSMCIRSLKGPWVVVFWLQRGCYVMVPRASKACRFQRSRCLTNLVRIPIDAHLFFRVHGNGTMGT